jgi:hypothetical protein
MHFLVVDVKLLLVLFVLFVKQLIQISLGLKIEDVSFRLAQGVAVNLHYRKKRSALSALERS